MTLDLLDLLQGRSSYVVLLVGIVSIWIATIRIEDTPKRRLELREKPSKILLLLGFSSFLLSAAFYVIPERLTPYPRVAGRWSYEVRNGSGEFSHKGDCVIRQDGPTLEIQGTRRWTCRRVNGQNMCVKVNAPWSSKWAQLCSDRRIRFDYMISLPENHLQGYCSVELQRAPMDSMSGFYYMLPPFNPDTLNARHGEILFERIPEGGQLEAPTKDDLDTINQEQSTTKQSLLLPLP